MDLKEFIDLYSQGKLTTEKVLGFLENWQVDSLGHTHIDSSRKKRTGVEEFVYGKYKSIRQLKSIVAHYVSKKENVLITRLSGKKQTTLRSLFPQLHTSRIAGLAWALSKPIERKAKKRIVVVTGGTSDAKVAVEALITLKYLGYVPTWIKDAGVAGLQRILSKADILNSAHCLIVIAGMEGSLPTVVSGLTGKPIIAVPTSTGYGVADKGFTALKSMLSSCATTLAAVNIDNGFGAACFADAMMRQFPDVR